MRDGLARRLASSHRLIKLSRGTSRIGKINRLWRRETMGLPPIAVSGAAEFAGQYASYICNRAICAVGAADSRQTHHLGDYISKENRKGRCRTNAYSPSGGCGSATFIFSLIAFIHDFEFTRRVVKRLIADFT
jgi:hypothetical protein